MFEDDDLDLDFGDSLLEPMNIVKPIPIPNPTFKPKIPSAPFNTGLRSSNHPYPQQYPPSKKVPPAVPPAKTQKSITQQSVPEKDFNLDFSPKNVPSSTSKELASSSPRPLPHNASDTVQRPKVPHGDPMQGQYRPDQNGQPLIRKFPGPAGLMPRLSPGFHKTAKDDIEETEEPEDVIECEGLTNCVAWKKAIEELGIVAKDSLVEKFNTNWIKKKSQIGTTKKMPFFLCKIGKMDLTSVDPMVMLMDIEGKVDGSMHRDVVEQFGKEVRVGSVLVLQNVVVLVTSKKEYVNITMNNLIAIYTKSSVKHVKRVSKEDMLLVARELDKVRQQQLKSILGGDSHPSLSPSPQSLPPAWSTPQSRPSMSRISTPTLPPTPLIPTTSPRAPYIPMPSPQSPAQLSSPSPRLPTMPAPARTNFTFKSMNTPRLPLTSTQQLPSQAQSQHLIASLMADLDTSDIFSDF